MAKILWFGGILAGFLLGQNLETDQKPVNAASNIPPGFQGAGVAPGARFAILGQGFTTQLVTAGRGESPTTLGNVIVNVTSSGSTVPAVLRSVRATRIVAVMPYDAAPGKVQIRVQVGAREIGSVEAEVVPAAFGIQTHMDNGMGPAVTRQDDGGTHSTSRPARPGQALALSGTGLGLGGRAAGEAGQAGALEANVEATVGGKPATVLGKNRDECCDAADTVTIQIPEGVSGCYVPVQIKTEGVPSNFATIAVSADGSPCPDPAGLPAEDLTRLSGLENIRIGSVNLTRTTIMVAGAEQLTDNGSASFLRYSPVEFQAYGFMSVSPGQCMVVIMSGSVDSQVRVEPRFSALDAGPAITVSGPKGSKTLEKKSQDYSNKLGEDIRVPGLPFSLGTPYLDPGSYTLTNGSGGADVGGFTATLQIPASFRWTNQSEVLRDSGNGPITRSNDLRLAWSGATEGEVVTMTGISFNLEAKAVAMFLCSERGNAGSFTVPSSILSLLPPTPEAAAGMAGGLLTLAVSPASGAGRFTAPGLDAGFVSYSTATASTVSFR